MLEINLYVYDVHFCRSITKTWLSFYGAVHHVVCLMLC